MNSSRSDSRPDLLISVASEAVVSDLPPRAVRPSEKSFLDALAVAADVAVLSISIATVWAFARCGFGKLHRSGRPSSIAGSRALRSEDVFEGALGQDPNRTE
jgi:hypothetical protein